MPIQQLRNGGLYERLVELHGKAGVEVHDAGVATKFERQSLGEGQGYRFQNLGSVRGEQFSFNCPFCSDNRRRCYMHHLYATPEEKWKHGFTRLWQCFNEECQSDYENRQKMLDRITRKGKEDTFLIDKRVNVKPTIIKPRWPGVMFTLKRLVEEDPAHIAVQWCAARNIDVDYLARLDVRYCDFGDSKHPHCTGRLVVPFYRRNIETKKVEMAGWTARVVKTDNTDMPKWVHSKSPTKHIVYGLNSTLDWPIVTAVEGPGDRWASGPFAVATLGKKISLDKAMTIANAFKRKPLKGRVLTVMTDPDMSADAIRRGEEHHIEQAVSVFKKVIDCPVVPVYLPSRTDPGELYSSYLHYSIARAVDDAGYSETVDRFYEKLEDYSARLRGTATTT